MSSLSCSENNESKKIISFLRRDGRWEDGMGGGALGIAAEHTAAAATMAAVSSVSGLALPCGGGVLHLLLQDGHDQVVLGHQVVLHDKAREAVAQEGLVLEGGGGSGEIQVVPLALTHSHYTHQKRRFINRRYISGVHF